MQPEYLDKPNFTPMTDEEKERLRVMMEETKTLMESFDSVELEVFIFQQD